LLKKVPEAGRGVTGKLEARVRIWGGWPEGDGTDSGCKKGTLEKSNPGRTLGEGALKLGVGSAKWESPRGAEKGEGEIALSGSENRIDTLGAREENKTP